MDLVLTDLFEHSKGWKSTYNLLVCVEWALQRDLLTLELIQQLRLHLAVLAQTSAVRLDFKASGWRVCEKLATVLVLLSACDEEVKQMLRDLKAQQNHKC